jgi:hypothetical protein
VTALSPLMGHSLYLLMGHSFPSRGALFPFSWDTLFPLSWDTLSTLVGHSFPHFPLRAFLEREGGREGGTRLKQGAVSTTGML